MGDTFEVVDLTAGASPLQSASDLGTVDLDSLKAQLSAIRDAMTPVLEEQAGNDGFRLQSMELALTVSLEGKVWFIAKGSADASLKLTFGRGETP